MGWQVRISKGVPPHQRVEATLIRAAPRAGRGWPPQSGSLRSAQKGRGRDGASVGALYALCLWPWLTNATATAKTTRAYRCAVNRTPVGARGARERNCF